MGRSNDGCYRTRVNCPRCHSRWGTPESGLQPYEYTFFMQGLKTYVCCGCLLQFGCMTAEHHCPHVSRPNPPTRAIGPCLQIPSLCTCRNARQPQSQPQVTL